jgi:hypothetical protein
MTQGVGNTRKLMEKIVDSQGLLFVFSKILQGDMALLYKYVQV